MCFVSFLGTCAAIPTAERDNVSILFGFDSSKDKIEDRGKRNILVDIGGSPVKKLDYLGCDWRNLEALIITHAHPDHMYGIHSLVHCLGLRADNRPLKIYALPKTADIIISTLVIQFRKELSSLPIFLKTIPLEITTFYEDEKLRITAVPADHRIEALSLVFEWMNGSHRDDDKDDDPFRVVYSSDTRPNYKIREYIDSADVVIHECTFLDTDLYHAKQHGHSTTKEAALFANAMKAKVLFPCHFDLHSGNSVDDYEKEVRQNFFGKRVIVPEELEKYRFENF